MSSQYGELRPTTGWDWLASLEHPSKFQRVSRLGFVAAATCLNGGQPNFARCLAVSWAGTLYIHFWRLLPRDGILLSAKFTLRPTLAFSYIGSVTARHWSVGVSQTLRRGRWNGITELSLLVIFNRGRHLYSEGGHHVGHRCPHSSCFSLYVFRLWFRAVDEAGFKVH